MLFYFKKLSSVIKLFPYSSFKNLKIWKFANDEILTLCINNVCSAKSFADYEKFYIVHCAKVFRWSLWKRICEFQLRKQNFIKLEIMLCCTNIPNHIWFSYFYFAQQCLVNWNRLCELGLIHRYLLKLNSAIFAKLCETLVCSLRNSAV